MAIDCGALKLAVYPVVPALLTPALENLETLLPLVEKLKLMTQTLPEPSIAIEYG